MIIKTYKFNRKTRCYIKFCNDLFYVNTGKPSDRTCINFCITKDFSVAEKESLDYMDRFKSVF
jgi:hypothetical protein